MCIIFFNVWITLGKLPLLAPLYSYGNQGSEMVTLWPESTHLVSSRSISHSEREEPLGQGRTRKRNSRSLQRSHSEGAGRGVVRERGDGQL